MKKPRVSNVKSLASKPFAALSEYSGIKYQERSSFQNSWELALDRVDLALIPSTEYATQGSLLGFKYGISYRDRSSRLILYAHQAINSLHTIYFYDGGASSVLLKLLLAEFWMLDPRMVRIRTKIDIKDLKKGEGILILHEQPIDLDQVDTLIKEDLVQVWRGWTGLPFVFHVWAASEQIRNFTGLTKLVDLFDEIVYARESSTKNTSSSDASLLLNDEEIQGLNCFYELCSSRNLLPPTKYRLIELGSSKKIRQKPLSQIFDDVIAGKRISFSEGVRLAKDASLSELGMTAELLKSGLYSENKFKVLEVVDLSQDNFQENLAKVKSDWILLKNINPNESNLNFYLDLLNTIKQNSTTKVEGFAVGDILELSDKSGQSMHKVVEKLAQAGLDLVSGDYYTITFDGKGSFLQIFEEWLRLMRWSHRYAPGSSCSIPFMADEHWEEWVLYLLMIRRLQDFTQGFRYFYLDFEKTSIVPAEQYLRQVSLARIFLDNISSQATFAYQPDYWLNRLSLEFGSNMLVTLSS